MPTAMASIPDTLLQWAVVNVDVNCSFMVRRGDLYPLPDVASGVVYRSFFGSQKCVDGAAAVSCVEVSGPGPHNSTLFDATTSGSNAATCGPLPNQCAHSLALWHVWHAPNADALVLPLGDLGA